MHRIGVTSLVFAILSLSTTARASESPESACVRELLRHPKDAQHSPLPNPETHLLEVIGSACSAAFPELSRAATKAARLPRVERSKILGDAASADLGAACQIASWVQPATALASPCLSGIQRPVKPSLLARADAGTALFVAALWAHLAGAHDEPLAVFFESLLLASGLEGEASGGHQAT